MHKVVFGSAVLLALAACGGTQEDFMSPEQVCAEQAALARNGTVDGQAITITCPADDVQYSTATSGTIE